MKSNSSLLIIFAGSALVLLLEGCAGAALRQKSSEWSTAASGVPEEGLVSPKASRTNVSPIYPIAMRREGIEGSVNVECIIDQYGRVFGATVASTSNYAFSAPALAAVRRWTFEPGTRHGVASAMLVALPIEFIMAP
jgi:TonB family protein